MPTAVALVQPSVRHPVVLVVALVAHLELVAQVARGSAAGQQPVVVPVVVGEVAQVVQRLLMLAVLVVTTIQVPGVVQGE